MRQILRDHSDILMQETKLQKRGKPNGASSVTQLAIDQTEFLISPRYLLRNRPDKASKSRSIHTTKT